MKLIKHTINIPGYSTPGAELTAYLVSNYDSIDAKRLHPAVLILPGGGYNHVSDREKEPVALKFLAAGIQTFTLQYSVAPAVYPQALAEALEAILYIRNHAEEYHIQPNNLSVCGFSAGGHLALSTAGLWSDSGIQNLLSNPGRTARPDKLILSYPVVTSGLFSHQGSFDSLSAGLSGQEKELLLEKLSMEKQVTKDFPPVFLWHTFSDETVPVQNSLLLAFALAENHIPTEMHIYPEGPHGLSLGSFLSDSKIRCHQDHPCSGWIDLAIHFAYKQIA